MAADLIKAGSISQSDIAALSIGTEQLLNASVTELKLATNTVTSTRSLVGQSQPPTPGSDSVGPIQPIEVRAAAVAAGVSGGAGGKNHIAAQSISTGDSGRDHQRLIGVNRLMGCGLRLPIFGSEG